MDRPISHLLGSLCHFTPHIGDILVLVYLCCQKHRLQNGQAHMDTNAIQGASLGTKAWQKAYVHFWVPGLELGWAGPGRGMYRTATFRLGAGLPSPLSL